VMDAVDADNERQGPPAFFSDADNVGIPDVSRALWVHATAGIFFAQRRGRRRWVPTAHMAMDATVFCMASEMEGHDQKPDKLQHRATKIPLQRDDDSHILRWATMGANVAMVADSFCMGENFWSFWKVPEYPFGADAVFGRFTFCVISGSFWKVPD
jgi:hypothetical protein